MSLESILEDKEHKIEVKGAQVEVKTITMGVLPKVIRGIGVLQKFLASGFTEFDLITEKWTDVMEMIVALTDQDVEFVNSLSSYEAVTLLEGIYEVNKKDFLLLNQKVTSMESKLKTTPKKSGPTQSKASSQKVMNLGK